MIPHNKLTVGEKYSKKDLIDIYSWKPSSIGKTTRSKISNKRLLV